MTAPTQMPTRTHLGRRGQLLFDYVLSKIVPLQSGYLRDESAATGSLARLRRAVATSPGADPAVWSVLFDGLPTSLQGHTDEPSRAERAVHAALTLYAVHQQGRDAPMHRAGPSLGAAAGELARALARAEASGINQGVLRRFQALGTATSLTETLYHARGLITQLRGEKVALDYGRLAVDLDRFQDPRLADGVRLSWGRDFYRIHPDRSATKSAGPRAEGESS